MDILFLKKKLKILKISRGFGFFLEIILGFAIVALFTGLRVLVKTDLVFINGFFDSFSALYIHFSELLFLVLFLFSTFFRYRNFNFKVDIYLKSFLLLLFFLFISLFFSSDFVNSFFVFVKYLVFFGVFLLLSSDYLKIKSLMLILVTCGLFISIIGFLQFFLQSSVGLSFIGEPHLSLLPGIAKVNLGDFVFIRPYALFDHPNIFAFFLAFIVCLLLFFRSFLGSKTSIILAFLLSLTVLISFSRSAILALLLVWSVFLVINLRSRLILVFPFFFFLLLVVYQVFFSDFNSLIERLLYLKISLGMFFMNPFGVGLGNFTHIMGEITPIALEPWQYQPVHNAFILIFNEAGFFVGSLFIYLVFLPVFKISLVPQTKRFIVLALFILIFVSGLVDHLLITSLQGLFVLVFYLALSRRFIDNRL